jgi:hypothetical protein
MPRSREGVSESDLRWRLGRRSSARPVERSGEISGGFDYNDQHGLQLLSAQWTLTDVLFVEGLAGTVEGRGGR